MAAQFGGSYADGDGLDDDDADIDGPGLRPRPLGLRGLQWIRRNMTSLRIIVSLQRVTPPEPPDDVPRRAFRS